MYENTVQSKKNQLFTHCAKKTIQTKPKDLTGVITDDICSALVP